MVEASPVIARPPARRVTAAAPRAAAPPTMNATATSTDSGTASTVRLLHRRRGWMLTLISGVVAWLMAAGLLGSVTNNGSRCPPDRIAAGTDAHP